MPDIDYAVDIQVTAAQGMVTAAIPLAGYASEHWLALFGMMASRTGPEPQRPEAEKREGRTWVIVKVSAGTSLRPESALDAVSALISQVNGMEKQSQSDAAETEAAVRDWWARQQR